jgi:hypothetical protein
VVEGVAGGMQAVEVAVRVDLSVSPKRSSSRRISALTSATPKTMPRWVRMMSARSQRRW